MSLDIRVQRWWTNNNRKSKVRVRAELLSLSIDVPPADKRDLATKYENLKLMDILKILPY